VPVNANAFGWSRKLQGASHAFMQVQLIGPAGQLGTVRGALLDTGASHSMFGALMAAQAGYNITGLATTSITLANGAVTVVQFIPNAQLIVEGHSITMGQLLLRPGKGVDLLCPDDLLNATEFGYDAQNVFFD
jgi:hypothetical protein